MLLATALCGQTPKPRSGPPLHADPFPLSDVRRGLHGTAWTVFEGVDPEPMDVEILGRLKDAIGPGQDMILGRLHGTRPEFTGVVAGMSGSPVYIDGKLLGALSYRIGQFSKEPICGITPIASMFQVRDLPAVAPSDGSVASPTGILGSSGGSMGLQAHGSDPAAISSLAPAQGGSVGSQTHGSDPAAISSLAPAQGGSVGLQAHESTLTISGALAPASNNQLHAIDTPLVFNGFSAQTVAQYAEGFRNLGLEPVNGIGSASPETAQPEPIVPGSAVSAVLARGDLNVAATCTVTYVDAKQLLACGHPITQFGNISIPMTKATVLATLPSPMNAFKIVNTTETVGSFTQDRANAVAGTFGLSARMIPVTVDVTPEPGSSLPAQALKFEVLDNRQLTPQVMLASVFQSLNQNNTAANQMSLRVTGNIAIDGQSPVTLSNTFAASDTQSAAQQATVYFAQRFLAVFGNDLAQPRITGIQIHTVAIPRRLSVELESARLSTNEAQPGDTITVEATLRPFQQPPRVVRIPVTLPTTLTPGPIRILVGDAASLDRLLKPQQSSALLVGAQQPQQNLDLADTVAQLNRSHSNDRVYVTLLDHQTQAVTPATALPSLPPSIANAMQPLRSSRQVSFTSETAAEAGSAPADAELSGSEVLTIRIR